MARLLRHSDRAKLCPFFLLNIFKKGGVYYVPQKFTDNIKKVTIEHFFVHYQTELPQWFCDFLKEHNVKFEIKS